MNAVRLSKRQFGLGVLALTAACAALAYGLYRRDLNAARARLAGASEIAATRCGPTEYADVGTGAPLLVVHGAGGGFDQGLTIGAPLVARGHRVIAVSRFGYLRTPLPPDASAAAQADAHACLLDALGVERAAVVGASAGAPSALQLAVRHPERVSALVLMVPAAYAPRPGGEAAVRTPPGTLRLFATALRFDFVFWAIRRAAPTLMIRGVLGTPPELVERADAAERARVGAMLDEILPVSDRRLGLVNDAIVTTTIARYALEHVSAPTLTISAADDLYGTYEAARYTAEQIRGARFVGYADGGHVLVGRDAEVTSEIAEFLATAGN
ncbi:MAG TPA: alpha/beta hydrolase [Gammaproteobacteria bacterium]|nr:alpha/beta hydrolase [Gammaproteobacteria bacterium]